MARPKIVAINDDPDFLDLIEDIVADSRDYDVQVIEQGMGVIERLKEISPDAIVLDVRLEYDRLGYHVLEGMRREPGLRRIPVIVCTADSDFLEAHHAHLSALDSDWIAKPFLIEDLLRKIDEAIAKAGSDDG